MNPSKVPKINDGIVRFRSFVIFLHPFSILSKFQKNYVQCFINFGGFPLDLPIGLPFDENSTGSAISSALDLPGSPQECKASLRFDKLDRLCEVIPSLDIAARESSSMTSPWNVSDAR